MQPTSIADRPPFRGLTSSSERSTISTLRKLIIAVIAAAVLIAAPATALASTAQSPMTWHAVSSSIQPGGTATLTTAAVAAHPADNASDPTIKNNYSHFCLGTVAGHNNAAALQWRCNGTKNQDWHWGARGHGGNQIVNANGDCLGVAGGSTLSGARVVAWNCNGHPDQYWTYSPYSEPPGGPTHFINTETRFFLDVSGNPRSEGSPVIVRTQDSAASQWWLSSLTK